MVFKKKSPDATNIGPIYIVVDNYYSAIIDFPEHLFLGKVPFLQVNFRCKNKSHAMNNLLLITLKHNVSNKIASLVYD